MKFNKSNIALNIAVIAIVALILIPEFKTLVLRGMIKTGLYNPTIQTKGDISSYKNLTPYKAPDARILSSEGDTLKLNDTNGKIIFLNFWATWCPPCIAEMPSIQTLKNKLKNNDAVIFAMVDADSNLSASSAFMKRKKYDLPVYKQISALPKDFFNGTLPTTVIINLHGEIVMRHEGMGDYDSQEMLDFLNSISK